MTRIKKIFNSIVNTIVISLVLLYITIGVFVIYFSSILYTVFIKKK